MSLCYFNWDDTELQVVACQWKKKKLTDEPNFHISLILKQIVDDFFLS